jgi:murein DD-endopeptidase MepM/ murein hydrolase activator NlpD
MLRTKSKLQAGLLAVLLLASVGDHAVFAEGNVEQDRQQVKDMKGQLDGLDKQQQDMLDQIHKMEVEIRDAMQKSDQLRQEITDTKKQIGEQEQKLGGRVKVMYEGGDVSFWEVLMESTDFSDFVDRFSMLTMIAQQDKKLVDELKANVDKLNNAQSQLEAEQKDRLDKQQQMQAMEKELDSKYKQLSSEVSQKEKDIAESEAAAKAAYISYQASAPTSAAAPAAAPATTSAPASETETESTPQIIGGGGGGFFSWPLPASHNITSGFGPRWGTFHKGIDIAAPVGTPIVAAADGTVIQSGPASGYGHWIVIAHSNGMVSIYGHMYADELKVSAGEVVKKGQVIAGVGSDGQSTGPHLHFSLADGGMSNYVNPMGYLN